jgi:hypothetical protein
LIEATKEQQALIHKQEEQIQAGAKLTAELRTIRASLESPGEGTRKSSG